jgi:UrcA family protein
MKNPFVIAFASALITAGALRAEAALAETPSGNVETYVSYVKTADLDLASEGGQRTFERRVAQAAREVCGVPSDADLVGQNKARECREDAIAKASSERDAVLAAKRGPVVAITASR